MKLAIFDFDGTIYKKETFTLLMQHLKITYPKRYRRFFMAILPVYIGYKVKVIEEKRMKARLMERYIRALNGLNSQEMDEYFEDTAKQMEGDFNTDVIQELKHHKEAGHYTMILSGAFTPLLQAVNKRLSLHANTVIGTAIPQQDETFLHVHGNNKMTVLKHHLNDKNIDWEGSYAYGDSASDLAVLKQVGHPVAVSPDTTLSQIANKHGWEVIE